MFRSCLKEDLAHGLSVVNHAVPNRAPLAITQNVLLSAKDSKLKLSTTNLEIFITTWAGAVIQEEGEITVPARLLTELVNSLPNERIDLKPREAIGDCPGSKSLWAKPSVRKHSGSTTWEVGTSIPNSRICYNQKNLTLPLRH